MKVSTVSAGCLANDGHEEVGVDPIQTKVDLINQGRTPIIEQKIGDIITANVKSGRLGTVVDPAEAIQAADLSFVCVGTPSPANRKNTCSLRIQFGPK
jgi:GDP-mannose 6-dehydrogenase